MGSYLLDYVIFWVPAGLVWWVSTRCDEGGWPHRILTGVAIALFAAPVVIHMLMRALRSAGVW